jgi:hypothetical protein
MKLTEVSRLIKTVAKGHAVQSWRAPFIVLAMVILVAGCTGLQASAKNSYTDEWTAEAMPKTGQIRLLLRYQTTTYGVGTITLLGKPERFKSLAQALASDNGTVKFQITHDAGTLSLEGSGQGGKASGKWSYLPDPAFVSELTRRGYSAPTPDQQFYLTLHDVGVALLDEIKAQGYEKPSMEQLVTLGTHGVDVEYLREMKAVNYKFDSIDALILMRDHGVNATYVRALNDLGFTQLPADMVLRSLDHGVTPRFIKEIKANGVADVSLDELIRLRDHGVTVEFIKTVKAHGYSNLSADKLINLRIHGLSK